MNLHLKKIQNVFFKILGLDHVKRRWADQKPDGSEHAEIVTMCCAIKPIASWHLEEVVTTTRERCGGQVKHIGEKFVLNCASNIIQIILIFGHDEISIS